ncbi:MULTISPECIES: hypothetical protein [Leptospirillum]|uniref:hypothetical protein n=1 Tax=Leptospirillum TaxID=179 RepID=UPI000685F898|nr:MULTISPECIES: hypothetical protein [Leptospirillum]
MGQSRLDLPWPDRRAAKASSSSSSVAPATPGTSPSVEVAVSGDSARERERLAPGAINRWAIRAS